MNLNMNLSLEEDQESTNRVKEATQRKKQATYQPTWKEIWFDGYQAKAGGAVKKGIFQTKLSDKDKERLQSVKVAVENGDLPIGVTDMKKFTKTHALRLFKVLQESQREETIAKMIKEKPKNYHTIRTKKDLSKVVSDLRNESEVAVDTETTGLNYFVDTIVGISITLPRHDYHVYIPSGHVEDGLLVLNQLPLEYVLEELREEFESDRLKKIYFNAKYDIHMFRRHGVRMGGFLFDGYVAMKMMNENEMSYAMKNLASKYGKFFGFEDKSATYEELFGKGGFEPTPIDIGSVYACKDTHLTYLFYKEFLLKHFNRMPDLKKLYFEVERPILEVCVEMEQNGFEVDMDFANKYGDELRAELAGMEEGLKREFGDVNLNSPAQLKKVLYVDKGLPDVSKKESTDAKTLKKLAEYDSGVKLILGYREVSKLLNTYVEALPSRIQADGRLHGEFNQVDTVTGRFASKEPNLQNIPQKARSLIVAPKGSIIYGADFSQIEPRLLSHLSNDDTMINAYVEGRDLYSEMASNVFKLDMKYCLDGTYDPTGTFQPRKTVKAVLLGIMYGMGSKTLAENIGVDEEEAKKIIGDFMETYPKVKAYIEERHQHAFDHEYVTTMYGRKRRFPGHKQNAKAYLMKAKQARQRLKREPDEFIWNEKTLPYKMKAGIWEHGKSYHGVNRQSVNATIQGSAADVMKVAMVLLYDHCKKKGFRMVATVHDEVLIEMPDTTTREEMNEIDEIMKSCINISVPMKVDGEVMHRWGQGMGKDEWFEYKETGHIEREMKGKTQVYNDTTLFWEDK